MNLDAKLKNLISSFQLIELSRFTLEEIKEDSEFLENNGGKKNISLVLVDSNTLVELEGAVLFRDVMFCWTSADIENCKSELKAIANQMLESVVTLSLDGYGKSWVLVKNEFRK